MRRTIGRRTIAAAFHRMANGVQDQAAYSSTIEFYRSSGHEWTLRLG